MLRLSAYADKFLRRIVKMRANYLVNVTPQFRVLSDGQIEEIYHSALDVLERVGTRIYGEEGLALLRDAGCLVSDGDAEGGSGSHLVRIPSWLVKEALNNESPSRDVTAINAFIWKRTRSTMAPDPIALT
jgi:trimethylamine--corrinoid protein Co-methyltransferase